MKEQPFDSITKEASLAKHTKKSNNTSIDEFDSMSIKDMKLQIQSLQELFRKKRDAAQTKWQMAYSQKSCVDRLSSQPLVETEKMEFYANCKFEQHADGDVWQHVHVAQSIG